MRLKRQKGRRSKVLSPTFPPSGGLGAAKEHDPEVMASRPCRCQGQARRSGFELAAACQQAEAAQRQEREARRLRGRVHRPGGAERVEYVSAALAVERAE